METQNNFPEPVANFLLKTSRGDLFTQTVKPDLARLVHLLDEADAHVQDILALTEFPDLDEHSVIQIDITNKTEDKFDFNLECVFFMSEGKTATELARDLSARHNTLVTCTHEGVSQSQYIDGHMHFSMAFDGVTSNKL